jgi:lipoprotein-anchoring transpeptidase ErfK/SrfK
MLKFLRVSILFVGLAMLAAMRVPTASAASPNFVIVSYGDTLAGIAARVGATIDALARANGLPNPNFIYVGQRIMVPPGVGTSNAPVNVPAAGSVYTVAAGDSLTIVASRFGTTIDNLMRVNNLINPNFIYVGQRLNVPGKNPAPATKPASVPASTPARTNPAPPTSGKWIDVDISAQTITAYEGSQAIKSVLVSTGLSWTPTPIGRYSVYVKIPSQTMSGGFGASAYYLPGVPWVMYFTGAYAIHGTYWHHNFGSPMSHGCVNLSIADAQWFYNWAQVGTPVVSHP